MSDGRGNIDPLDDEDQPMQGTSRGRAAMAAGLVALIFIVAFLAWFIATHWDRTRPGGIVG